MGAGHAFPAIILHVLRLQAALYQINFHKSTPNPGSGFAKPVSGMKGDPRCGQEKV
jgi:hypothetical protein